MFWVIPDCVSLCMMYLWKSLCLQSPVPRADLAVECSTRCLVCRVSLHLLHPPLSLVSQPSSLRLIGPPWPLHACCYYTFHCSFLFGARLAGLAGGCLCLALFWCNRYLASPGPGVRAELLLGSPCHQPPVQHLSLRPALTVSWPGHRALTLSWEADLWPEVSPWVSGRGWCWKSEGDHRVAVPRVTQDSVPIYLVSVHTHSAQIRVHSQWLPQSPEYFVSYEKVGPIYGANNVY